MDRMALEAVLKPVKHCWPLGGFLVGGVREYPQEPF